MRRTRKQCVGKQLENNAQREHARELREFELTFRREQREAQAGAAR